MWQRLLGAPLPRAQPAQPAGRPDAVRQDHRRRRGAFDTFFSETGAGKHVPRAIMVDLVRADRPRPPVGSLSLRPRTSPIPGTAPSLLTLAHSTGHPLAHLPLVHSPVDLRPVKRPPTYFTARPSPQVPNAVVEPHNFLL